jgi:hypothetical protein
MLDIASLVEQAMTEEEKDDFLKRFLALNPRWRGAKVADVLDALYAQDAHLEDTEPMFEAHGKDVPEKFLLTMCTLVVKYVCGEVIWESVEHLVRRVRAQV